MGCIFYDLYFADEYFFIVQVLHEHHQTTHRIPETEETVPVTASSSTSTSTTTTERVTQPSTTLSTTTSTTTTTTPVTTVIPAEPEVILNKQKQVNEYEEYNYDNYDDEDDNVEGPVESETIIPVFSKKQTDEPRAEVTEIVTAEGSTTAKTTIGETVVNIPVTEPVSSTTTLMHTKMTTTSTTTTTEPPTTPQIIVETEPEVCLNATCFVLLRFFNILVI